MSTPRVLFITSNVEDYLGDGLLHGLRGLLGGQVVDFPKAEFLYDSYSRERRAALYGRGFSLYTLLPDLPLDRTHVLERAEAGAFDLVVVNDIWRSFGLFTQLAPVLPASTRLAVVDGSDRVEPYPYAGRWWRVRAWWALPRAHRRAVYFKRELAPATAWFRSYLLLPGPLGRRLGLLRAFRPIGFSFPAEKVVADGPAAKEQLLATHVVDPEVAAQLRDGQTSYAFADEAAYYADLRRSRYGITTRKAGWDCLRHLELAANGCVPCFRELWRKPPQTAPFGLDESNCVPYGSFDDLMARLDSVDDQGYACLRAGALAWARANTTVRRAAELLTVMGLPPPAPTVPAPSAPAAGSA